MDVVQSRRKRVSAALPRLAGMGLALGLALALPVEVDAARGPGEISDVADQVSTPS